MAKKGWPGDLTCAFCDQHESTEHLFIYCSYVRLIWNWIASHNSFTFNCNSLDDLWLLDASIPLKDRLLVELLRGAILWIVWLERNRVIFHDNSTPISAKSLGLKIISLATFWCKSRSENSYLKLSLMLPYDVKDLPDHILEEEEESTQVSGTGSPPGQMSGEELTDEDLLDYE